MYDNGIVSVIIPVYNAAKYIGQTIESALHQTYENMEIIVVDDCSTDSSADIIRHYVKEYNNIVYWRENENSGAAMARNIALNLARGRYVAFLDSDDLWAPEKISKQIKLMQMNNALLSFSAIEMIDANGKRIKTKRNVQEKIEYKFLLKNTMIATSSVVVDRRYAGNFSMVMRRCGQDYATWLQLMRNGATAHGINEALVQYRVSQNSLSSSKWKSIGQVWSIQRNDEKIDALSVAINVIFFSFNALKKWYL